MHRSGSPLNESFDSNSYKRFSKVGCNGIIGGIGSKALSANSTALDVVRHYVNPAVYIESKLVDTMDALAPFKKSPSFDCFIAETPRRPRIVKVKKCVCLTNENSCPIHENIEENCPNSESDSKLSVMLDTARSETDSGIRRSGSMIEDELRLSLSSLTSARTDANVPSTGRGGGPGGGGGLSIRVGGSLRSTVTLTDAIKEQRFREWCEGKDAQKRLLEHKEMLEQQQQKISLEQLELQAREERESFLNWLAEKKREEERQKRIISEKIAKDNELKTKRAQESKLTYQSWLQRKEEELREKKRKDQFSLSEVAEERQKRKEFNDRAFELWLNQSMNKPRPIPLNQGLRSLNSSVSVSYINPKAWVPNVDIKPKPASQ